MEGACNDFMVLDGVTKPVDLKTSDILALSDRRRGVGFDQLLILEPAKKTDADFYYRVHNADGSLAEQCGNGARCLYLFIKNNGLSKKKTITVETIKGMMTLSVNCSGLISVDMGVPTFSPRAIPFKVPKEEESYTLRLDESFVTIGAVSMGNPHAVNLVSNVDQARVQQWGSCIEKHAYFPNGCNVGFMEIKDENNILLRVWERGVGETPACGTGACAAAAIGILWGLNKSPVNVLTRGGKLTITWKGKGHNLQLAGPARQVYEGEISI